MGLSYFLAESITNIWHDRYAIDACFYQNCATPTIFHGRAAELIPEGLAEITAGTKSATICDLGNRFFGLCQHLTSLLQTVASDVFYRGHV